MPSAKVYSIQGDEHSEQEESPSTSSRPSAVDTMSSKLEEAKKLGHSSRLRISGMCGGIGAGLVLFLCASLFVFPVGSDPAWAAATIGFFGMPGMLLALLPTDARSIYWVGRFIMFVSAIGTIPNVLHTIRSPYTDACEAGNNYLDTTYENTPSWYCFVIRATTLSWALITCATSSMLVRAQFLPPRASLNRLWVAAGWFTAGFGFIGVTALLFKTIATPHDELDARQMTWQIVRNTTWITIGILIKSSKFRATVHSALLARGGQVSSASAIAALMGGRSPVTVRQTASKNFKGVTLGPGGVTYALLADRAPNPDELSAISRPCKFGEVDYFVSHSWRDNLKVKWDILWKIRTDFVKEHGREPVMWIDK